MRKLTITLMVLLPVVSMATLTTSLVNPLVGDYPPIMGNFAPLDGIYGEIPFIIATGSTMFTGAAWYGNLDGNSNPYPGNDLPLKLVEHCINYLLSDGNYDGINDPVTTANIGCIGDFDGDELSGLQTHFDGTDTQFNQNYMAFVEGNLNSLGNSYTLTQIDNSTALNVGSTLNYDLLMIGENWDAGFLSGHNNYLHSRAEFNSYLTNGGKVIIAGTKEISGTGNNYLVFLPKDEISMQRIFGGLDEFPLPPVDPSHPITFGIDSEEWDYTAEVISRINYIDTEEYYKVFPVWSGQCYLVVGAEFWAIEEATWGQIKALDF
ncbi:hypothetical protein K8R78_02550 [bacterium]|nr:hypothetical protein [bacterium]